MSLEKPIKKAAAIVVNRNQEILLLKKKGLNFYILPGGKVEADETLIEALYREIKEELNCGIISHEYLKAFASKTPDTNENINIYAFIVALDGEPKVGNEIESMIWHSKDGHLDYPLTESLENQILPEVFDNMHFEED